MMAKCSALLWMAVILAARAASAQEMQDSVMWRPGLDPSQADTYAAFRGAFELAADTEVEIRPLGAAWFVLWLDGEYLTEGPARFPIKYPEYEARRVTLGAGRHVLAAQVHHEGLSTRILDNVPPFLYCAVVADGKELPVRWKCTPLDGFKAQVRRINAQLGWIEWCDTRKLLEDWQEPQFDDASWEEPVPAIVPLGEMRPLSSGLVQQFPHALAPTAEGPLAEVFGYEQDNIPARFFLRDLECTELPRQGVWRRYDLGRVRLGRPSFVLDLPEGAVVEFAYSEALAHGRVSPWITLSASDSCSLDHYVARGGEQEFSPLTPRSGRFMEIHVLAPPEQVRFVEEQFIERCYYGAPEGAFACGDPLLEQIWMTGVETHRACAEDALIDNPTRERGQWAGDVVAVGMDIAAAAYGDLRLCRRGLMQCAQSARDDGLISGLCPGGGAFLSTYAAQWVSACLHYWELTGDRALLEELYPFAEKNFAAFENHMSDDGLLDDVGWGFVDWGYVRNDGPADIGVNLHYLAALRDMLRWSDVLDKSNEREHYAGLEQRMAGILREWFNQQRRDGKWDWDTIGYHRAVLGLRLGFFPDDENAAAVSYIKRHMLRCFPNDPAAPRLSDPGQNQSRLITPYFAHYAMPVLIENGEMDFVLDQYRRCWGWMLESDRTTWVEVFDTRWSHCHQWAGCPTWQLSRYVLGLHPRFDLGKNHFELRLIPGSLERASGRVPLPGAADGATIGVEWQVEPDGGIEYSLNTPETVWIHEKRQPQPAELRGQQRLQLVKTTYEWNVAQE